eukprot:g1005.t1
MLILKKLSLCGRSCTTLRLASARQCQLPSSAAFCTVSGASIESGGAGARKRSLPSSDSSFDDIRAAQGVQGLIHAFRSHGHLIADIDPLGLSIDDPQQAPFSLADLPALQYQTYGFTKEDLSRRVYVGDLLSGLGLGQWCRLDAVLHALHQAYSGPVGIDIAHIVGDASRKRWLRSRFESMMCAVDGVSCDGNSRHNFDLTPDRRKSVLKETVRAQLFEEFLGSRFSGAKRFSIEGCEAFVPGLSALLHAARASGVRWAELGMAHRGRLNTLVNVLQIPAASVLREFQAYVPDLPAYYPSHADDVRYHLGCVAEIRDDNDGDGSGGLCVAVAANPSHLEEVNAVVLGKARARQRFLQLGIASLLSPDTTPTITPRNRPMSAAEAQRAVLPIIVHGDCSLFLGANAESIQLTNLSDYTTGGCIHLVINNQIGFTTLPAAAHSAIHSTDVFKGIGTPILHVNADCLDAVVKTFELALEYRQAHLRDICINLVGYRRHGHNEQDQPGITQPRMYGRIARMETAAELMARTLVADAIIGEDDLSLLCEETIDDYSSALELSKTDVHMNTVPTLKALAQQRSAVLANALQQRDRRPYKHSHDHRLTDTDENGKMEWKEHSWGEDWAHSDTSASKSSAIAGVGDEENAEQREGARLVQLRQRFFAARTDTKVTSSTPEIDWHTEFTPSLGTAVKTSVDASLLVKIAERIYTLPDNDVLQVHDTVARIVRKRLRAVHKGRGIDWANAEALAFGSLLAEGYHVRLSGQDCERGTFNQRHAVWHDQNRKRGFATRERRVHIPLQSVAQVQENLTDAEDERENGTDTTIVKHNVSYAAIPSSFVEPASQNTDSRLPIVGQGGSANDVFRGTFEVCNSPLSEHAVLGFEHGYSLFSPSVLVCWEAQFGDFANGAQTVIDTFIASGEQKWVRQSGLVMLLPHGLEGQGPDHSSARVERFLQMCDEDPSDAPPRGSAAALARAALVNMHIVMPSTPAQYFHLLRRQMLSPFRKPLVVFTPKFLLHHSQAVSVMSDFTGRTSNEIECASTDDEETNNVSHGFRAVQPDPRPNFLQPDAAIKRVVICSGQFYYTLARMRAARRDSDVALVRLEQFCPFPFHELGEEISKYTSATELVWAQEEAKNMGAWSYVEPRAMTAIRCAQLRDPVAARKNGRWLLREISFAGRPCSASPATGSFKRHQQETRVLSRFVLSGAVPE